MKHVTAIAIILLIFGPAYGRESKHSKRSLAASRAAVTASHKASETGDSETDDQDKDETDTDTDTDTDDQQTTDDDNDAETDDMDTDDHDTTDMNDNDEADDDSDDMDDTTTTVTKAIQNALKAAALTHSEKPFANLTAALDAGLNARQTLDQLLEPTGSGSTMAALLSSALSTNGNSALRRSGNVEAVGGASNGLTASSRGGKLSPAAVPEPATWILAAVGILCSALRKSRR